METSLIIPALNEAERIGVVLQVALDSGLFSEIIVVDDGSNDGTAQAAEQPGVQVICHSVNKGKAVAMQTGIAASSGEVITFLDADLLNVTAVHLEELVRPVSSGEHRAALAVFRGGRMATSLAQKISPMISGQRCLLRSLLAEFNVWDSGFGIETALNDYLKRCGVIQEIVEWEGAAQVMKEEKRGLLQGFIARLKMFWEIFAAWIRAR